MKVREQLFLPPLTSPLLIFLLLNSKSLSPSPFRNIFIPSPSPSFFLSVFTVCSPLFFVFSLSIFLSLAFLLCSVLNQKQEPKIQNSSSRLFTPQNGSIGFCIPFPSPHSLSITKSSLFFAFQLLKTVCKRCKLLPVIAEGKTRNERREMMTGLPGVSVMSNWRLFLPSLFSFSFFLLLLLKLKTRKVFDEIART